MSPNGTLQSSVTWKVFRKKKVLYTPDLFRYDYTGQFVSPSVGKYFLRNFHTPYVVARAYFFSLCFLYVVSVLLSLSSGPVGSVDVFVFLSSPCFLPVALLVRRFLILSLLFRSGLKYRLLFRCVVLWLFSFFFAVLFRRVFDAHSF